MQDNELDKLINDAANQHHPPYDDGSWSKMLVLLDKHLPEKKDRRRPFVFWLLFLLLGGAVTVATLQPWKKSSTDNTGTPALPGAHTGSNNTVQQSSPETVSANTGAAVPGTTPVNEPAAAAVTAGDNNHTGTHSHIRQEQATALPPNNTKQEPAITTNAGTGDEAAVVSKTGKSRLYNKGRSSVKIKRPAVAEETDEPFLVKQQKNVKDKTEAKAAPPAVEEKEETGNTGDTLAAEETKTADASTQQKEPADKKDPAVKETAPGSKPGSSTAKKDRSFAGNFSLTVSTGADMSFVEFKKPGKVKLFYGAGAAYTIGSHLKLSSGFYVSKKVYSAEPYQYKFPGGTVYPHLTGIDANCTVYEIPLNVYYSFRQHKNHNWFAGAGISSLLMKNEYYNYLYRTTAGQPYSYAKTITNENEHYFSVVTLSGGYQYAVSRRISLVAEPYLKLPLAGVGAGKIKLNSSGLLLSAAVKPFGRTKK